MNDESKGLEYNRFNIEQSSLEVFNPYGPLQMCENHKLPVTIMWWWWGRGCCEGRGVNTEETSLDHYHDLLLS